LAGNFSVKPAEAIGWSDVASSEAALIERCLAGDEAAHATLVFEHHRLVLGLATHLLGDREEALDLSQEVFLRVFRTLHRFRGQSALRTWIFRIVVNQVRNRQRWWKRRQRSNQVSLDEHIRDHGELVRRRRVDAGPELTRKSRLAPQDRDSEPPFEQYALEADRRAGQNEEIAYRWGCRWGP
jgi:RNA polymerase sigma-70 factor (ECF subfamily)